MDRKCLWTRRYSSYSSSSSLRIFIFLFSKKSKNSKKLKKCGWFWMKTFPKNFIAIQEELPIGQSTQHFARIRPRNKSEYNSMVFNFATYTFCRLLNSLHLGQHIQHLSAGVNLIELKCKAENVCLCVCMCVFVGMSGRKWKRAQSVAEFSCRTKSAWLLLSSNYILHKSSFIIGVVQWAKLESNGRDGE